MKIIFLDFDGVLTRTDDPSSFRSLSKIAVDNLNSLVDMVPDVNIVITSTWRKYQSLPDLLNIMTDAGFRYSSLVMGVTPDMNNKRGYDISAWIRKNNRPIDSMVILDDDDDMCGFRRKLVQTSFNNGLTMNDVKKACDILRG